MEWAQRVCMYLEYLYEVTVDCWTLYVGGGGCVCMRVCMKVCAQTCAIQKLTSDVVSQGLPTLFYLRQYFLLGLKLINEVTLNGQGFACLSSQYWNYKHIPLYLAFFYIGSGDQTQVFMFVWQALYLLNDHPSMLISSSFSWNFILLVHYRLYSVQRPSTHAHFSKPHPTVYRQTRLLPRYVFPGSLC